MEWKSWQGKTCTKGLVLLKFVQSDSCQISLKWNWKGKTNFLWEQSSAHLVCCTCLICFPVKKFWPCLFENIVYTSTGIITFNSRLYNIYKDYIKIHFCLFKTTEMPNFEKKPVLFPFVSSNVIFKALAWDRQHNF